MMLLKGKNIVKGITQVSGHSLKLFFCMFERSKVKHSSASTKCAPFFFKIGEDFNIND
jgi:hypothetical protein